jgi:hypothetical protein
VSEEQGWRLKSRLEGGGADTRHGLDRVLGRLRGPDVTDEVRGAVAQDVVITHDGELLFAYASSESALQSARSAIEDVLRRDGVSASMTVSHWDAERDEWIQTDPVPEDQGEAGERAASADEDIETRTLVASTGRAIQAEFEQTMLEWAERLDLECKIIEHPHLLSTQVAFTITGPKHRINEFAQGLRAEGNSTMRTETAVMLSPL